jgi:simple sugar transport system ATP-binding protein
LVATFPVKDNLVLNSYKKAPYARGMRVDRRAIRARAEKLVKDFDVRTPSIDAPAGTLSGGNQQKVIAAREFTQADTLLIAAQPTRGLDVGSIQYIHAEIVAKRDEGKAVLIVSSELDEIFALGDRIAVMYQGKVVAILDARKATRDQVGLLMSGVT